MTAHASIGWFGPNNDAWEWILKHFHDVKLLREQDINPWIAGHSSRSVSDNADGIPILILASDFRSDPIADLVLNLKPSDAPKPGSSCVPWCVLLGTDWGGHRRTQPLPESWHTFYWYELYDRIMPWLSQVGLWNGNVTPTTSNGSTVTSNRKISLRVQRWIDSAMAMNQRQRESVGVDSKGVNEARSIQMALVVTENADSRQLWSEALSRRNIQSVCTIPSLLDIWLKPDILVIDLENEPLQRTLDERNFETSPVLTTVRTLSRQFPDAFQIVIDPFPRWERWALLQELGADILVGKPFCLDGILDSLLYC